MAKVPDIVLTKKRRSSRKISWETFQKKYAQREDKYKYEWVNGKVEKTLRSMNQTQLYIQRNLIRALYKLDAQTVIYGELISEGDAFFKGRHRIPDIAFYTNEQLEAARKKEQPVPQFIIEIISSTDQMNLVHKKMEEYLAAEVKVIWHILPALKVVHVYEGNTMTICKEEAICSADSVIKGFALSVNDIFKTPPLK